VYAGDTEAFANIVKEMKRRGGFHLIARSEGFPLEVYAGEAVLDVGVEIFVAAFFGGDE
jgi:hypothetical protein